MSDDEPDLVRRCRAQDPDAFRELLERHQRALFGLARRITGDREEAMDALQDSCVKAWQAIPGMRGDSFAAWMSTIVARTSLDRVRSRRPATPIATGDDDDVSRVIALPDPRPGPEHLAIAAQRVRLIEAALATLSPDHRAIVLMRDMGDLSYEEIAGTLGVPIGTVRSRLARARVALQEELLRRDPAILEAIG